MRLPKSYHGLRFLWYGFGFALMVTFVWFSFLSLDLERQRLEFLIACKEVRLVLSDHQKEKTPQSAENLTNAWSAVGKAEYFSRLDKVAEGSFLADNPSGCKVSECVELYNYTTGKFAQEVPEDGFLRETISFLEENAKLRSGVRDLVLSSSFALVAIAWLLAPIQLYGEYREQLGKSQA
jgi:hypothetical protein